MAKSISYDPVTQPSIGSAQDVSAAPTLSRGAKGDDVRELQKLLNRHGNKIAVDGDFGPITEAAVITFQKANKLKEDGIVSETVWAALWDLWLFTVTLSSQSDQEDVRMAQKRLKQFGYPLVLDSIYGSQTIKALQHYQALRHPVFGLKLSEYSRYVENLQNDSTLGIQSEKKDSLVYIARIMLGDGYELTYVTGLLANSYHEGNVGQFESSSYIKKPEYLENMDKKYNYGELYSGKTIMKVSLSNVEKLLKELAKDDWEKGKFGLGSIQWTGNRCLKLVEHYRAVAGDSDRITKIQALQAEGNFILEELKDVKQGYILIYPDWRNANKGNLNSGEAAEAAAQELCKRYEKPADTDKKAMERGKTSIKIYNIMSASAPPFIGSKKAKKKKKKRFWD